MMKSQSSEGRKRKLSSKTKFKFEFQLPKKQANSILQPSLPSFTDRVAWVIEARDYTPLSLKQIEEEYTGLRKELHNINVEVEKAIRKMDTRSFRKGKTTEQDVAKTLEVTDKEVENNQGILDRLRKEYFQLQKRVSGISGASKETVEEDIQKAKQDIDKCKIKIKQLKMKNKTIGDSIVGSDDLFDEIRKLEAEKEVHDKKKIKLQSKTDHVYEQIATSELKLEEISDSHTIAQNYFQEYYNKSQQNSQMKDLQAKYQHAKHSLEIVSRKNETSNNLKQQKYHILLKNLEGQMGKLNIAEQKTASVELEIIHCKKLILELEAQYKRNQIKKEILNQEPVFFTEFESDQPDEKIVSKKQHPHTTRNQPQVPLQIVPKLQTNNQISTPPPIKQFPISQDSQTTTKPINPNHNPNYNTNPNPKINTNTNSNTNTNNNTNTNTTSNNQQSDMQQEQDIIYELDEKFKYKNKQPLPQDRDTQIGEDLPHDYPDDEPNDQDIRQFRDQVAQQKSNRNEKDIDNVKQDIDRIRSQIDKFDFMKANDDSYD